MNGKLIRAFGCIIKDAVKDIVNAINGTEAPDYTALLTAIKDSVSNIDANTDDVEKLLDTINTTNTQIVTNTGETVTILKEVLEQVTAINANTDEQEALLTAILDELKLHAKLVTNIGTTCASIKGGAPEFVTVLAWHTDQGEHLKSTFMNSKLEHFTEDEVKLLDDCDCKCKEC